MAIALKTCCLLLALIAPVAAQTAAPSTAVVEGAVINVQNSRTIPRAVVTLLRTKGGSQSKSTRADGNGHFLFQNVEPGSYRLIAERQGFFSDDRKREYQPMFDVTEGQHVRNVPVRLIPSALVSGEILDEYNDPVQNVEVSLLKLQMRLGHVYLSSAAKTITDDRGQYRIAGLHSGKYYLVAEYKPSSALAELIRTQTAAQVSEQNNITSNARRNVNAQLPEPEVPEPAFSYPPLFYPATGDFQQAQALQLRAGDEVSANFILTSVPVVSIRGRVTNGTTGRPAMGASVAAYWTVYMEGSGVPAQASKETGQFIIRGLAPGVYTLRASFTEDGQTFAGEQTVEVGTQGLQNVDIAALPDFAVTGHVTVMAEMRQNPITRVGIEFVGEGLMPRIQASATMPKMEFSAQLRPNHRYRANVRNLPEDYYLKSVAICGSQVPPENIVVSGSGGVMELVLSPAGGHIEGTLLDSKDQPTRGSILLVPNLSDPGPPELFRRTTADGKGKFVLRGVAPGSYKLLALESLNVESETNSPEFLRSLGNRGDGLIVEEDGKYTVSLRLNIESQ